MVEIVAVVVGLVTLTAVVRAGARRFGVPDPIALLVVGAGVSWVPGVPPLRIDPDLVLVVLLPVLLYCAAFAASLPAFRRHVRPILLLSVGLTIVSALAVGVVGRSARYAQISRGDPAAGEDPAVAVPMVVGARVIGVVECWDSPDGEVDGQRLSSVEMLATLAGSAIEASRLHAATERLSEFDPLTQLANRRRLGVDLERAVEGAMLAKMRNIGEACTAANRFYVHADIAEEFTKKLTERMGDMKIGRGTEEGVEVGPLVEADQRDKVAELVDDAVQKGATVRTGGQVPSGAGYFYPPTVLADVPTSARLAKEEIFGPVAPIFTFTEDDDAVRAANDTEFGLVSYLYTKDLSRAIRLSERLEAGMVGLNQGMVSNAGAPFGGWKQSGLGREGGSVGIEEYLEIKYVAMNV